MKTQQEIEALKRNWLSDPCWDIEDTEGFEEYKGELKQFRYDQQRKWVAEEYNRVFDRARSLGIEDLGSKDLEPDLRLMKYLEGLERQIKSLNEAYELTQGERRK